MPGYRKHTKLNRKAFSCTTSTLYHQQRIHVLGIGITNISAHFKGKKIINPCYSSIIEVCQLLLLLFSPSFKQPNPSYMHSRAFLYVWDGREYRNVQGLHVFCQEHNTLLFHFQWAFYISHLQGRGAFLLLLPTRQPVNLNSKRSHKEGLKLICTVCYRSDSLQSLYTNP